MSLTSCLENLINGNLAEAKEDAKGYSFPILAREALNWHASQAQALAAAAYLKGAMTYQEYCDHK